MADMQVIGTRLELRDWSDEMRGRGDRIALVPTMGALHRGHMSLVTQAWKTADRVALSIFVNPLQFGPSEDFDRYPRDLAKDVEIAADAGVDVVFAPPVAEMYPHGEPWVAVVPERGADVLCGASRPGHFRGVLTVVAKLFGIANPHMAVFGQKDYQQLVLIRRMAADLDFAIEIHSAPIAREDDGLAISSRNRYLSPDERRSALALYQALVRCVALFDKGETDPAAYRERLNHLDAPGVSVEYGEVVDPDTLAPVDRVEKGSACMLAAMVGRTRLIDNHILGTPLVA